MPELSLENREVCPVGKAFQAETAWCGGGPACCAGFQGVEEILLLVSK